MLVSASTLMNTRVLSVRAAGAVSQVDGLVVNPEGLKIMAFHLAGGIVPRSGPSYLLAGDVREYSPYGLAIDDTEDLVNPDDVIRLAEVLRLNFGLIGLKVETKQGSKLGKVVDFTVTSEDFIVQQLIVRRPPLKALMDPQLIIPRKEIVEVTDYKVIVKDEEKKLKEKAAKEEFVPNFVNPFRNPESGFAPADRKNPGDKDIG